MEINVHEALSSSHGVFFFFLIIMKKLLFNSFDCAKSYICTPNTV